MKYIVKNKKNMIKGCIIFIFLCILLCSRYVNKQVRYINGEERFTCSLKNEEILNQKLYLDNIKKIKLSAFIVYNGQSNSRFEIICKDNNYEYRKEIKLKELLNSEWNRIVIADPILEKMDNPVLTIKPVYLEENEEVNFLIVKGEEQEGITLFSEKNIWESSSLEMYCYVINDGMIMRCLVISLLITIIIVMSMIFLPHLINKNITASIAILLFGFSWFRMDIFHTPVTEWANIKYAVSFKYGILAQALPGTVVNLFTNMITENTVKFVAMIFMIMALCIFLKHINYNYIDNETIKKNVEIFVGIFIVSPFFFLSTYFSNNAVYAFFDPLTLAFYMVCMYLAYKDKGLIFIPIISAIAVLCYQQFVFCCFPILFLYMIYCGEIRKEKKYKIYAVILCISSGIIAVYSQFYGVLDKVTLNDICSHIQENVSWIVNPDTIKKQYFTSIKGILEYVNSETIDYFMLPFKWGILIIIISPIIVYWYKIWKKLIRVQDKIMYKILFILMICSIIIPFITFLIQTDWGRYTVCFIFSLFIVMLCLSKEKQSGMGEAILIANDEIKNKWGKNWYVILGIYMLCLSSLGASVHTIIEQLPTNIMNIFDKLLMS